MVIRTADLQVDELQEQEATSGSSPRLFLQTFAFKRVSASRLRQLSEASLTSSRIFLTVVYAEMLQDKSQIFLTEEPLSDLRQRDGWIY